jgi:transposase-like protein
VLGPTDRKERHKRHFEEAVRLYDELKSYRKVAAEMLRRGVKVSHTAIRDWVVGDNNLPVR